MGRWWGGELAVGLGREGWMDGSGSGGLGIRVWVADWGDGGGWVTVQNDIYDTRTGV